MNQITLQKLSIRSFKGIKELDINFNPKSTNIYGDNATGKTTIFDAFTWLLFGKDSDDRKDFNIKPLDANNEPLHRVENEVEAIMLIGGQETTLKRINREKWTKKRGETTETFTGNETLFYHNDVPCQAGEYQKVVADILNENIFKLVTNPLYFNSLKWNERRSILEGIADSLTDEEIAGENPAFRKLLKDLGNKTTMEQRMKQINEKKKKLKDDLSDIPTRIDELHRNMPEKGDFAKVEKEVEKLTKEIQEIDDEIGDKLKTLEKMNEKELKMVEEVSKKRTKIIEIQGEIRSKVTMENANQSNDVSVAIAERSGLQDMLKHKQELIRSKQLILEDLNKDRDELLAKWHELNALVFVMDEDECACPTCKRPFETDDLEAKKDTLRDAFNLRKNADMQNITSQGKVIKDNIDKLNGDIAHFDEQIPKMIKKIANLEQDMKDADPSEEKGVDFDALFLENKEIQKLNAEITKLQDAINNREEIDLTKQKSAKDELLSQVDGLKSQLNARDQIAKTNTRIDELKAEETTKAQELADLEAQEDVIKEFSKVKVTALEESVNSKFSLVKFKMFKQNINGGEEETCISLINGVPFSDANNASKINGGIDIINTLCKHYEVTAPIFTDNAEAVNLLTKTNSQVIRLVVTKDKSLIIN